MKRLHRELDAGRLVVNARQMTVAEYLDYWLAELLPGTVKASTEASYADMTRRHIVPALGHLSLAKLSRDDIRRFVRQLARTKSRRRGADQVLSGRTVQYVYSILRRALEDARREELVGRNVAQEVPSPRFERREFEPLAPDEARTLLAAVADHRLYPVYVLALMLGLRRGEILGLRWSAVDLDRATLRVQTSLQRIGPQLVLASPKTKRSRRAIPLPRAVVKVLEALADQHHFGHLHPRHAGAVPGGGGRPRCVAWGRRRRRPGRRGRCALTGLGVHRWVQTAGRDA